MDGAVMFLVIVCFIVVLIDIILNLIIAKKVRAVTELVITHDTAIDSLVTVVLKMEEKKNESNDKHADETVEMNQK